MRYFIDEWYFCLNVRGIQETRTCKKVSKCVENDDVMQKFSVYLKNINLIKVFFIINSVFNLYL